MVAFKVCRRHTILVDFIPRVKSCHLAHRFSQTCMPSLNDPYGAVRGPSAELREFSLSWLLQVNTAALRCIAVMVQAPINRTQLDEVEPWH